ncbi:phosphoinositide 3-kinase [Pseudohyphozyma bogoriensis]|nr:phosphoinositide 3-kinase [Pseudohyphozyma bogoriensis]
MNASNSSAASLDYTLTIAKHSSLDFPVSLKISTFQGTLPQASLSELLATPSLKHAGAQQALPSDLYVGFRLWSDNKPLTPENRTAHKAFRNKDNVKWDENFVLPIKYRDLPLGAQLAITVYDIAGPRKVAVVGGSTLRLFGKKATLKKGKQRLYLWKGIEADGGVESETPSKVGLGERDEMGRLEKLVKKHQRGDVKRVDWLDKAAFREIEKVHKEESAKSENLFLYVDLPRFDFPVVFSEPDYPLPTLPTLLPTLNLPLPTNPSFSFSQPGEPPLFTIIDPEVARDNPVEAKHRRLVRSHRKGPLNRELKPNAKIRDELNEILRYPPTVTLTANELDLLWQFRFYLTRDKRALTKFLKSVVWSDPGEVSQAVETLLPMWATVEVDDALELLGPSTAFRDRRVRAYAVGVLGGAEDDELMLYLLQLVQALKFDILPSPTSSSSSSITRSRHRLPPPPPDNLPTLEEFLIQRGVRNPVLANHFMWYLRVESQDGGPNGRMYEEVAKKFERRVAELHPDRAELQTRQTEFIAKLSVVAKDLRSSKDPRPKKIEKLRSMLHDSRSGLGTFPPLPLPLDARKTIVGINPDQSSIFKSAMLPLRLHLLCEDGIEYPVIYKNGDDLRQDQLIIQLFTLMDRLLRKENLDLKLLPYQVLATGVQEGMVQFVQSKTIADISSEYGGSLLNYLKAHHGDPASVGTLGVKPEVLETYIRSCAGYCVVTYLLGVGDRHLDNLLLSPDGHFFHVDFGYILGADPKPFAPAVKVCKEMVDAMGGLHSPHYAKFKNLCYIGFTSLRKNANLIINLVGLMVDANIQEIKAEPDKAVAKVQDKFLLNLSEDDAIKVFEGLLNETSYFTSVLDRIHSVAQYWSFHVVTLAASGVQVVQTCQAVRSVPIRAHADPSAMLECCDEQDFYGLNHSDVLQGGLALNRHHELRFYGPTSSYRAVLSGEQASVASLTHAHNAAVYNQDGEPLLPRKPPTLEKSLETKVLDLAFEFCLTHFELVEKEEFMREMEANGPKSRGTHYSQFLHTMVLAIGCRYLSPDEPFPPEICGIIGDSSTRGDVYAEWARYLLNGAEWDGPKLSTVRGLTLISVYYAGRGYDGASWVYGGQAMRLVQDFGLHLGIHRLAIGSGGIDESLIRARRHAFYSSFSIDVLLSLYIGRPPTLTTEDIDLSVPAISQEVDFTLTPNYRSSVFHWHTTLILLASKMMSTVYALKPVSLAARRAAVSDIHLALESWYHDLPAHLRAATTVSSRAPHPIIIGLNLQYFNIMAHLHRPFFRRINTESQCDNLSTQKCLSSAKHIVRLLRLQKEAHGLRFVTPGFQHACFCAGTILALSSVEDEISETLEKDAERRAQARIDLKSMTSALREMGVTWRTAYTSAAVLEGLMAQWGSTSTTVHPAPAPSIDEVGVAFLPTAEDNGTVTGVGAGGEEGDLVLPDPFWPSTFNNGVGQSFPYMFPSWDMDPTGNLDGFMSLLNPGPETDLSDWKF